MKSIAIFNNKGGVGKTTVLCNLASYMAFKLNKKVLVVDADPQCNTSSYVMDEDLFTRIYLHNSEKVSKIVDIISSLEDGLGFLHI